MLNFDSKRNIDPKPKLTEGVLLAINHIPSSYSSAGGGGGQVQHPWSVKGLKGTVVSRNCHAQSIVQGYLNIASPGLYIFYRVSQSASLEI